MSEQYVHGELVEYKKQALTLLPTISLHETINEAALFSRRTRFVRLEALITLPGGLQVGKHGTEI